ncbi:dihydrofolate reductase family protein [Nocardioides sp. LMS-CY]|uniref:dihydrofolate reductase family protein n=1 Tax=Nocardioides sp. (strain LMS-CY) TaxID=2840457 RepID=UPI001C0037E2|nr:dihydrofolate reductase family protein [Nocardioides sp. LMS-CY]QWF20250.1 dihydrofolate reductase family protein [Nocardioides sp. LMS-CY]
MRTLISSAFVSLDGVVDSPGGGTPSESHRSGGWTFKDIDFLPEVYELKGREMEEAAAMLFGRVSYEAFAPVWPGMTEFAVVKDIPKYVVSSTMADDDLVDGWGPTTILRSTDDVRALKDSDGGPILMAGSAELNRSLSDAGLIDRYHLLVFPVLLGAGKRLFSDSDRERQRLRLVEHEVYANGVQKNVFDVVR